MTPYLETIFCDDVRQETSGKRTLVGVYGHTLLVESFPITLPKLCLVMRLVIPANTDFERISFEIIKGDESILTAEIPPEVVEQVKTKESADVIEDLKGEKVFLFPSQVVLSPIVFEEAVPLKVRVTLDDSELKGIGLQVATRSAFNASEDSEQKSASA